MDFEDRIVAALHLLPRDRRLNLLAAEVAAKVGVRDIHSVADLISAIDEPVASPAPLPPPQRAIKVGMVGGALTADEKRKLLIVCGILIYLASVFGLVRLAGDLRLIITGAVGGVAFLPGLIRFARELFTERRLFVARLLETEDDVVVRLEFNQIDGTLNHENDVRGVTYSTVVGPMDHTYGELPRLDGGILFALLHRQNVRLLPNGAIDIPRVNFQIMRARLLGVHRLPDYEEERQYYFNAEAAAGGGAAAGAGAVHQFHPQEPIETIQVLRGREEDGSIARNSITFEDLQDGDIIISFRYGNGGRIYNKETHTGAILLLSTYNDPRGSQTIYVNQPIHLASRRAYRVQLVDAITEPPQIGGRRRRKTNKRRKIRRRTVRR